MNFIGADLAWKTSDKPRARTGLAVISSGGHLTDTALVGGLGAGYILLPK